MPDEAALATVAAAVDAIVPPVDGRPGAVELGVPRHVVESIDLFVPGFVDLLVTLLDAYAMDVRPGASFVQLDVGERQRVLALLSSEEGSDLSDVIDGLLVFTYGGTYSEWTGYDRETRTLRRPAAWDDVGFHGPVRGHPDFDRDR